LKTNSKGNKVIPIEKKKEKKKRKTILLLKLDQLKLIYMLEQGLVGVYP